MVEKVKTAETGKLGLTVIFQDKITLEKGEFYLSCLMGLFRASSNIQQTLYTGHHSCHR